MMPFFQEHTMKEIISKELVIHPFLFSIFPILALFSKNLATVYPKQILLPLAVFLLLTAIVFFSMSRILRDMVKSGLLLSIFLIFFFSYGHLYFFLRSLFENQPFTLALIRHRFFLPLYIIALFLSSYVIVRTHKRLEFVNIVFNYISLFLVVVNALSIFSYYVPKTTLSLNSPRKDRLKDETRFLLPKDSGYLPDIYYIILDEYAGFKTIKKYYDYDPIRFYDYLVEKGFFIADDSRSNYILTSYSIPSALNMTYIHKDMHLNSKNRVAEFLKSKGYKYVYVSHIYPSITQDQDLIICSSPLDDFSQALFNYSILILFSETVWRTSLLKLFDEVGFISQIPGPKLVFIYICSPHPPFVFGPNGESIMYTDHTNWTNKQFYLSQWVFITKKIQAIIETLLLGSEREPIIIVHSDHGVRAVDRPFSFEIFNACYLPDKNYHLLYESISPVNIFRVVFNSHFGAHYEILKDKMYIHDRTFTNFTEFPYTSLK